MAGRRAGGVPEVSAAVVAASPTGLPYSQAGAWVEDEASQCWNRLFDWRNALPGKTARWRRLVNVFRPPERDRAIHAKPAGVYAGRPSGVGKPKPRWRCGGHLTAVSRTQTIMSEFRGGRPPVSPLLLKGARPREGGEGGADGASPTRSVKASTRSKSALRRPRTLYQVRAF